MNYKPFDEIIQEKYTLGENINYVDELSSLEWKTKREIILERDDFECKECFKKQSIFKEGKYYVAYSKEEQEEFEKKLNEIYIEASKLLGLLDLEHIKSDPQFHQVYDPIILHVHHKYYVKGKLAWEYPNEALVCLCQTCHQELHNNTIIKVYENEKMDLEIKLTTCKKCKGCGYISKYNYFMDGICFSCMGYKFEELIRR
jgi:hypothetical protein